MADSEPQPIATPKKMNRPPRKRNKNDTQRNDVEKNAFKNSAEPSAGKGGGLVGDKTDAAVTQHVSADKGSSNATPEKKDNRQHSYQDKFSPAKKRNNNNMKKVNSPK